MSRIIWNERLVLFYFLGVLRGLSIVGVRVRRAQLTRINGQHLFETAPRNEKLLSFRFRN